MALAVNKVTNASIYVDGGSLLGKAEEIKLPDVVTKMVEHKALGMVGTVEFPAGIEKMEGSIKWNSFYADVIKTVGDPFKVHQLQVRSNLEQYSSAGKTEVPLVIFMSCSFKKLPGGNFKQHDNVELETMFNATSMKMIINGETVMEYDALANILKYGGVDVLAQFRANNGQ